MNSPDRKRAVSDAKRVLSSLGPPRIPVAVEELARASGASLSYQPFEGDISGVVIRQPGVVAIIGINSAHATTRQRFTVAHELGHLRLHKGEPLIVDKLVRFNLRASSLPTDQIEHEANWFAAALLMPDELVLREVRRLWPRRMPVVADDLVDELAQLFAVSPQAMSFRLRELEVLTQFEQF